MFTGLLLKESLTDQTPLSLVKITKEEIWDADNASPLQPKQWTAVRFEGEDKNLDKFLESLSDSLKPKAWYVNAQSDGMEYVIFPNKIFKYVSGDTKTKTLAQDFARSLEVPESQLGW